MTDKLLDNLLPELSDAGLNGWSNRETYCVAEWIAEDLEAWQAVARECYRDARADNLLTRADIAWCDLGKQITSRFRAEIEEEHGPLSCELLRLATTRINWTQLVWGVFQNRGNGTPREDFLRR